MGSGHGFMANPSLRGLRWSLLTTFRELFVLNLLGYVGASTRASEARDENVFDIASAGVAIHCGRTGQNPDLATVRYAECQGLRADKYSYLLAHTVATTPNEVVAPIPPFFALEPYDEDLQAEYARGIPLLQLFRISSTGIRTLRDSFVVDFEDAPILERVQRFRDSDAPDDQLCAELGLSMPGWWKVGASRRDLSREDNLASCMRSFSYRPFDRRRLFYNDALVGSPRRPVMRHMEELDDNIALHVCRQLSSPSWQHVLVTRGLTDDCYVSNRTKERGYYTVPLLLAAEAQALQLDTQIYNCDPRPFVERLPAGEDWCVSPDDVFAYVYSVAHSPTYRLRYLSFLKRDYPCVPIPRSAGLYESLVQSGKSLVALHLLDSPALDEGSVTYAGPSSPVVGVAEWSGDSVWINPQRAKTRAEADDARAGFHGVPEAVWEFNIGSYQVCYKWLKDRKGRTLSDEDIAHYQKIVVALSETLRLMQEIDEVIEEHGGWPDAFVMRESSAGV